MKAKTLPVIEPSWRDQFTPGMLVYVVDLPSNSNCQAEGEYGGGGCGCENPVFDFGYFDIEEYKVDDFLPSIAPQEFRDIPQRLKDMVTLVCLPLPTKKQLKNTASFHLSFYEEHMSRAKKLAEKAESNVKLKIGTREDRYTIVWYEAWKEVGFEGYLMSKTRRERYLHQEELNENRRIFFNKFEAVAFIRSELPTRFAAYRTAVQEMMMLQEIALERTLLKVKE